jgi:hypothetical protein
VFLLLVKEPLTPEQKDVFDWANKLLKANAPEYLLKNLSTDVRNGIKLLKLIEVYKVITPSSRITLL